MTTMLHEHDCRDDDEIVRLATDLAIARAKAQGRTMPTSGRPPQWLVAMIDDCIAEVLR